MIDRVALYLYYGSQKGRETKKMHFLAEKIKKDLRIWNKSSTFARFFARSRLKRAVLLRN